MLAHVFDPVKSTISIILSIFKSKISLTVLIPAALKHFKIESNNAKLLEVYV